MTRPGASSIETKRMLEESEGTIHENRIHRPRNHGQAHGQKPARRPATRWWSVHIDPTTAAELTAAGATTADSPKQIAEQVELVITMLPNSPDVKAVALGADGIIEGAHPGLVFVDMSSIAPLVSREIHDALAEKSIAMLDAPVSGGEPKAIDGTLSVMVGGDKEVFDQVKDVLGCHGRLGGVRR